MVRKVFAGVGAVLGFLVGYMFSGLSHFSWYTDDLFRFGHGAFYTAWICILIFATMGYFYKTVFNKSMSFKKEFSEKLQDDMKKD